MADWWTIIPSTVDENVLLFVAIHLVYRAAIEFVKLVID